MDAHQKRITEKIIEAIQSCQCGNLRFEDLEEFIASQLDALDFTYPKTVQSELRIFVQGLYEARLKHLDVPEEDKVVYGKFDRMLVLLETAMKGFI